MKTLMLHYTYYTPKNIIHRNKYDQWSVANVTLVVKFTAILIN